MFADYEFNGYELKTNKGRKYPAVALDFHAHVPAGTFTITLERGFSRPITNMSGPQSYNLVDKRRSLLYQFCLRNSKSPTHKGILADNALFHDEKLEGKTIDVSYSNPWMRTAMNEVGVAEDPRATAADPRILEYYKAAGYSSQTSDDNDTSAWCACYVSWVLAKHDYPLSPHAMGALAYREWNGAPYGQTLTDPVYGALAIKERKVKITEDGKEKEVVRGHIGFVMGQSRDGKYLYVLGGNQGDKVSVVQSLRTAWVAFRMPPGFGYASESLPVYIGDAVTTTRES